METLNVPNSISDELDMIAEHIEKILYFNEYSLPAIFFFVLSEIGFTRQEISEINSIIFKEKYLSYYELKILGFSYDQIQIIFYLLDYENVFFKPKVDNDDLKDKYTYIDCLYSNKQFHSDIVGLNFQQSCRCERCMKCPKLIAEWISRRGEDALVYLNLVKEKCRGKLKLIK